jgi:anti-repressor protein
VSAEVCRVLKISNPSDPATRLDDGEKHTLGNVEGIEGMGPRVQALILINESGLYSLILRSRKTEAKRFQKWATAEALPSIRNVGATRPTHALMPVGI